MAFSIGDYVTVNERLKAALDKFPDLRVHEDAPRFIEAPDGKTFIEVKMTVFRSPDDTLPMIGFIHEEYPGTTSFTKGAEQANASTSCLGRILGFMGFGIAKSIASRDDVERRETKPVHVPKVVTATYADGRTIPDPFTGEPQLHEVRAEGDSSPKQKGMIRALGRDRNVASGALLSAKVSEIIGRKVLKLDELSKREASQVIEAWKTVIPDPAGEIPTPLDEEPF